MTSQISQMTSHESQTTAPNLRIEAANGVTYAYRRFGNTETAALPLVFFVHFRANLDNWDPLLVDTIAQQREVILLDNTGVAGSTGTTPGTVEAMALDAITFTDALGLRRYDLLGFSLGGFVAQEVALIRPHQARRIVLAGTGPRGGRDMHVFTRVVLEIAVKAASVAEDLLTIFFEQTVTSQARGREFIDRLGSRREDRDAPVSLATRDAHLSAIETWGIPDPTRLNRLAGQRHHGPHREHLPAGRSPPQRPAQHLPRRRPRFPLPVPGRVRHRGKRVPGPVAPSQHLAGQTRPTAQPSRSAAGAQSAGAGPAGRKAASALSGDPSWARPRCGTCSTPPGRLSRRGNVRQQA